MIAFLKNLVVPFAIVGLVGSPVGANASDNLNGTWDGACHNLTTQEWSIKDTKWVGAATTYYDASCSEARETIRIEMRVTQGNKAILRDGQTSNTINQLVTGVFVSPHSTAETKHLNTRQRCEISTWKTNEEKNIEECPEFGVKVGDRLYDIYKTEDDRLYFGAYSGGPESPKNRPSTLNFKDFLQKK